MTDPRDHSVKTLEEAHKQPLTEQQNAVVQDIRLQVSPTIAAWVQTQFHLGNSANEIWIKLETVRNLVGTDTLEGTEHFTGPLDSAGIDLENVQMPMPDDVMLETILLGPIVPMEQENNDDYGVPTSHTTDSGG